MNGPGDPISDAVVDLRVAGSALLSDRYGSPWALAIPETEALGALLGQAPRTRVIAFHYARSGGFELSARGHPPLPVAAGELVLCPQGNAHTMCAGPRSRPVALRDLLEGRSDLSAARDANEATELICGAFFLHEAPLNPLLEALPEVMKVKTRGDDASPLLAGVVSLLHLQADAGQLRGFASARLLEILFEAAVRDRLRRTDDRSKGWFHALRDERVAAAMTAIHRRPEAVWTLDRLAGSVTLSPSRFAARFRETTGISVMRYVARVRINHACRLLRDTRLPAQQVADRVGYNSLPAFTRAFRQHLSMSPTAWRARLER